MGENEKDLSFHCYAGKEGLRQHKRCEEDYRAQDERSEMNTCEIRFTDGRMVIHALNSDEVLEVLKKCQKYTVPFIKIRPINQDVICLYNLCNIISIKIFNDKGE